MNTVKKNFAGAVRLMLLVLASEFLFSQFLSGQRSHGKAAEGAGKEIERQRIEN